MSSDRSDKANEVAKNIWLAGLGAYGKAFDTASEKYASASKEAPKHFNELVEKGLEVEQQARGQFSMPAMPSIPKPSIAIEERIEKMRSYLSFGSNSSVDVSELEKKVKKLTATVASLQKQLKTPADVTKAAKAKPVVK